MRYWTSILALALMTFELRTATAEEIPLKRIILETAEKDISFFILQARDSEGALSTRSIVILRKSSEIYLVEEGKNNELKIEFRGFLNRAALYEFFISKPILQDPVMLQRMPLLDLLTFHMVDNDGRAEDLNGWSVQVMGHDGTGVAAKVAQEALDRMALHHQPRISRSREVWDQLMAESKPILNSQPLIDMTYYRIVENRPSFAEFLGSRVELRTILPNAREAKMERTKTEDERMKISRLVMGLKMVGIFPGSLLAWRLFNHLMSPGLVRESSRSDDPVLDYYATGLALAMISVGATSITALAGAGLASVPIILSDLTLKGLSKGKLSLSPKFYWASAIGASAACTWAIQQLGP